ncbi:MAG: UbiD family decarboxylase, partial [Pirellulales bacterium]|nr:UbiD family decarboxylase [Pirellulales bacterium]
HSNLGMYRVQLSGGRYDPNREVGLHYQIHRGIGAHHAAAIRRGERLPVNVFVGGTPAMSVAAVMPMPEGASELPLAGILAGRRIPMVCSPGELPIYADADFCICGYIEAQRVLPEGPFGDHLGYYSLAHDFPVMTVEHVYHRHDAIWPFTVVGRPPQEDTIFGQLIHELAGGAIEKMLPGVRAVHAVDAAGVHPLLLALGSERYVPYDPDRRPRELLTQANAILGQGQLSLAKFLWIAAEEDDSSLDVYDVEKFLRHVLVRADWSRDLHFQTRTTIDTLDYSGTAMNEGSKLVIAAAGRPIRELPSELAMDLRLPEGLGFDRPMICPPGMLVVQGPCFAEDEKAVEKLAKIFSPGDTINRHPLIVVVDDSQAAARSLDDLLWMTFTRSNPASDVYGIGSFVDNKHWGARGSLIIDARVKPGHAPELVEDPEVTRRVDAMAARGGVLEGII